MKVLAISGSARRASTNTALLHGLAACAPDGVRVEVWAGVAGLPVFNPDEEGDRTPVPVREFAAQVAAADAIVVSCPEYVHALPGGFKNAIDWLVSREEIIGKPVALLHASHRGEDVLADLRRVLATVTEHFWTDVFLTVPVLRKTPEEIGAMCRAPEQAAALAEFLTSLQRRVASAAVAD
ncbi:NAD(P)H dehydrogenase (quinone) [Primorskyibacter flagellatus]|uniref:NAD(P)H dehydrogenase (Quinone) n=1 Tax=Primorskyibacter flagellatus TaxID=1387277 RepID=A0A917EFL9_9RHOB|nr:NADPH-dependent FMN reductase [Primorskyibacter flagellatus]GGE28771.1 NAD(P)H dehydrogenase (quinone) [Primorskyibacter flagellatus]